MSEIIYNSGIYKSYDSSEMDFRMIIESIKEIPKKLKEYIRHINEKTHSILSSENTMKLMAEFMYPYLIDDMFRKSNNIANFLKQNNLSKEYHAFLEIERMMKVIIKNKMDENNEEELNFLDDVLKDFTVLSDFIFAKCNSIKELSTFYEKEDKEYISKYDEFKDIFFKHKTKFYTQIYTSNKEHDSLVESLYVHINI